MTAKCTGGRPGCWWRQNRPFQETWICPWATDRGCHSAQALVLERQQDRGAVSCRLQGLSHVP